MFRRRGLVVALVACLSALLALAGTAQAAPVVVEVAPGTAPTTVAKRYGITPEHVYTEAVIGFSAEVTAAQRAALDLDRSVEVVSDDAVIARIEPPRFRADQPRWLEPRHSAGRAATAVHHRRDQASPSDAEQDRRHRRHRRQARRRRHRGARRRRGPHASRPQRRRRRGLRARQRLRRPRWPRHVRRRPGSRDRQRDRRRRHRPRRTHLGGTSRNGRTESYQDSSLLCGLELGGPQLSPDRCREPQPWRI